VPFVFERLEIPDIVLIKPKIFSDERGYFLELFKTSDFKNHNLRIDFVQDNISFSKNGVLRGLHYQKHPKVQGKLVCCIEGVILDVAVDIRKNSPTFGKYISIMLSEEEKNMLCIPAGFAHGFLVISDFAIVFYKVVGAEYSPEHDAGIIWNDPDIGIKWPIKRPILSPKDSKLPRLRELREDDLL